MRKNKAFASVFLTDEWQTYIAAKQINKVQISASQMLTFAFPNNQSQQK